MKNLLLRACEGLNIDEASLNKLNLKKLDYSYRVRYVKNGDGDVIQKIMDRGFIGLMKNKIGLDGDSVVNCFIYGKKTVGFYIEGSTLIANESLKKSSDFLCLMYNVIESKSLEFGGWTSGLPTGEVARSGAPKTLDDCINNAKTIESLGADLRF